MYGGKMNSITYYISKFFTKIQISAIKSSKIHSTSKIASKSHVVKISLDKYSYIGNNCFIQDCRIGSFCSIADNCIIGGSSHPIEWGATSSVFHEGNNILKKNFSLHSFETSKHTIIGNDVWIGNNVIIKSGVEVGNGSVIGMGSVVTKNIGDYEIWAGNPARLIRKRFSDETIELLNNSEWWNKSETEIKQIAVYINDINKFKKIINEEI